MAAAVHRFFEHLGRAAYCSNNKMASIIRAREVARGYQYVGLNQRLRFYLAFDIDHEGAAVAAEAVGLPPPTLTIINPASAHAHLLYELRAPIAATPGARGKPLRWAAAVELAYQTRLAALGADWGFGRLMVKNPSHPAWRTVEVDKQYDLGGLAEYVTQAELNQRRPRREVVGLGRNCSLFDGLRGWAYKNVRRAEDMEAWGNQCLARALALNAFESPLREREVASIARSVAGWTWRHRGGIGEGVRTEIRKKIVGAAGLFDGRREEEIAHLVAQLTKINIETVHQVLMHQNGA